MAHGAGGWVLYNNVGYNKGLHRFIDKQLHRWARESIPSDPPLEQWYRVTFDKEGIGKTINCRVEVCVEDRVFVALESAPSPDAALIRTLSRLTPQSAAAPTPEWTLFDRRLPEAG